jgi:porin
MDLSRWGASFAGINIGEVFTDVHGGAEKATVGDDLLGFEGNLELGPFAGWPHALAHASAFLLSGRGISGTALGSNLLTVSNIEAAPGARLHELWLEQLLLHRTVSVRVGQMAADSEFAVSGLSAGFLNGSHGWPALLAADLPEGGPAYPLASPAARVAWLPSAQVALAVGVYSTVRDAKNTSFPFGSGALVMLEGRYSFTFNSLPDSISLGYWHDSGIPGISAAADRETTSQPRRSGYYFLLDRTLAQTGHMALAGFARGFFADPGNAVTRFFDAGLDLVGLHADRQQDMLGIAVALAIPGAKTDEPSPPISRRQQLDLELTYSVTMHDAWTLQPDLQYVLHPGIRIAASGGQSVIPNALVLGMRVVYEF